MTLPNRNPQGGDSNGPKQNPPQPDELKHALDIAACGLLVADQAGVVQYANTVAVELLQCAAEPLLGSTLDFPLTPGISEIALPVGNRTPRFAELRVEPCRWAGGEALLVVVLDITDGKALATERERLLEVQRELVRSNREFSAFSHAAAHDLKSPLRQMRSFADLLAQDKQIEWHEKALTYLNFIRDAATRGSTLVERLLEYATYGNAALQVTAVDLNAVIKTVLAESRGLIDQSGAQIEVAELPVIDGDKTQLQRVFENLIGNALKYQKPDSPPAISIQCRTTAERTDCDILVTDNGIGFQQSDLERVFEPFQRLVSRSEYEGAGVGLATVKRIIKQHGGSITATSEPGAGSTFIVTLPLKQPATD